jgi:hypothetical protein
LLIKVAEKKNLGLELQAGMAKGISDLYMNAFNLATDIDGTDATSVSLKKYIDQDTKIYLNNRRYYYSALACIKMKDYHADIFKQSGQNYGMQISYLGLAVECLRQASKDLNKLSKKFPFLNAEEFSKFLSNMEILGQDMLDKNSRIYYEAVPDIAKLPKIEKVIKVNPIVNQDDFNIEEKMKNSTIPVLDKLVPRETKPMIANYKQSMMGYISQNLDKYENEAKIDAFLKNMNLPYALESSISSSSELPESLSRRITEVQRKGGILYLLNQVTNLEKQSEEISKKISDLELRLYTEEEEDKKMRNLYGPQWIRLPSQNVNSQFYQILQDYKQKLNVAHSCDNQIKNNLLENKTYFDMLSLSKSSLEKKIPNKQQEESEQMSTIKNSEEAKRLYSDLETLEDLKNKCMEIIDKIFHTLNEDNIIPQFLQLLQKKITEKEIFEQNKKKYDSFFSELEKISQEISQCKKNIAEAFENFLIFKSRFNVPKRDEVKEKFFEDLEKYVELYNNKILNINQGLNFYSEFQHKLNEISVKISDYLLARDLEKNEWIKALNTGQMYMGNYQSPSYKEPSFLDPLFNTITNMYYNYRYGNNEGKYYR